MINHTLNKSVNYSLNRHSELDPLIGFPLVMGEQPEVLVLGSMPGVASLEQQEYYAHPRNAFWSIMGKILNTDMNKPYTDKLMTLKDNRIALWDVIHCCTRKGSLDSKISRASVEINDFASLFAEVHTFKTILCNGHLAYSLFIQKVLPSLVDQSELRQLKSASENMSFITRAGLSLQLVRMPSSSPANARLSLTDKMGIWKARF